MTGGVAHALGVLAGLVQILYAWDRPESLATIVPAGTPIAVYAATVQLQRGAVVWRPRAHPIRLPPQTPEIAVIHVEPAPQAKRRVLDDALAQYLVEQIVATAHKTGVGEVQLDYEARLSERFFLRALVIALRRALPPVTRLSMTALASWCLDDRWLGDLPIDDVVPMVYRMGRDREPIRRRLDGGADFVEPRCRRSVAVSLADPPPRLPADRRRFFFNPRSWTAADVASALSSRTSP